MPSQAVRDQRALVAGRTKMVRLSTQAKNRLHAVLHRHHLATPGSAGASVVAIARKLLVAVWHVLTENVADRFAEPQRVARKLMQFT